MSSRDDLGSLEPNLEDLEDLDRYEPLDDLDRATAERTRRRPVASVLGAVLVILAAAAAAWYFLDLGGEDAGIPLVTADPEPVKVRPDKPGGLEVPHQEISVLNQPAREPAGEAERPEVLLPPPEAPLPVPSPPPAPIEAPGTGVPAVPTVAVEEAAPPAPAPSPQPEQITETLIPPVPPLPPGVVPSRSGGASSGESATGETEAQLAAPPLPEAPAIPPAPKNPAPPAVPPAPVAQTPTPAPEKPPVGVERPPPPPAPLPQARVETAPPPASPPAAPVVNGYRANVASAKNETDANRKVAQMRKAHADLFGPLPLRVRRVDLGGAKGVWYRVQAGAFAEVGQATALCEELKRRGEKGCWVGR
ncbi:MAG: SPOR domain-containing protein [Kiloniellales bacterium]